MPWAKVVGGLVSLVVAATGVSGCISGDRFAQISVDGLIVESPRGEVGVTWAWLSHDPIGGTQEAFEVAVERAGAWAHAKPQVLEGRFRFRAVCNLGWVFPISLIWRPERSQPEFLCLGVQSPGEMCKWFVTRTREGHLVLEEVVDVGGRVSSLTVAGEWEQVSPETDGAKRRSIEAPQWRIAFRCR